jgi:hypothetical protein
VTVSSGWPTDLSAEPAIISWSNARQKAETIRADGLVAHLNHLMAEVERLKQKAEQVKDYGTALACVRGILLLELLIRLTGDRPSCGIAVSLSVR